MKPNGIHGVARNVVFLVCAVGLFAGFGSAETVHGRFRLPIEARWGMLVLAPGEYEFTTETGSRIVTLRSDDSGWSGMILSVSASDLNGQSGSGLALAPSENGVYVQALNLGNFGLSLNFDAPKSGKSIRLVKTPTATIASSAPGTH